PPRAPAQLIAHDAEKAPITQNTKYGRVSRANAPRQKPATTPATTGMSQFSDALNMPPFYRVRRKVYITSALLATCRPSDSCASDRRRRMEAALWNACFDSLGEEAGAALECFYQGAEM